MHTVHVSVSVSLGHNPAGGPSPPKAMGTRFTERDHPCVSVFVSVCVYTCKSMFKDILRLLFTLDEILKVCLRGLHFRLKLGLDYS